MTNEAINIAIPFIQKWESFSKTPYRDSEGILTIGFGRTENVIEGDITTPASELHYLTTRLDNSYRRMAITIPGFNEYLPNQQAALLSFAWNNGDYFYGNDGYRTITKALDERNQFAIPASFILYRNPNSNSEGGLLRRKLAEASLWCSEYK